MAAATSSANRTIRASMSSANATGSVEQITAMPHTWPSTAIGTPTARMMPKFLAMSANDSTRCTSAGPSRMGAPPSRTIRR